MQLINIDIEHFFDLPALVFMKDRIGKYHACNDYAAKQVGLGEGKDLIGTTDFDHCWRAEAPFYQSMDKKVIDEQQPLLFIENITTSDQNLLSALTYKIPLQLLSQKTMVFGMSFIINQGDSIPELLHGMRVPFNVNTKKIVLQERKVSNSIMTNRVSQRQAECLYYLVKGMSARQIADEIGLSKRTIEAYIIILKQKFNCISKYELINKAWELDFIKDKLLNNK